MTAQATLARTPQSLHTRAVPAIAKPGWGFIPSVLSWFIFWHGFYEQQRCYPPSSAITTLPPAPNRIQQQSLREQRASADCRPSRSCVRCAKTSPLDGAAPASAHRAWVRCANPAELTQQPPRGSPVMSTLSTLTAERVACESIARLRTLWIWPRRTDRALANRKLPIYTQRATSSVAV